MTRKILKMIVAKRNKVKPWHIKLPLEVPLSTRDTQQIISRVKSEIEKLRKEVIGYNEIDAVLTIDRKGTHLYSPVKFLEHGLTVLSHRCVAGKKISIVSISAKSPTLGSVGRGTCLLVDSINEGEEVRQMMGHAEFKIRKVYSYISRKETLSKLGKEYPKIDFRSSYLVPGEDNYHKFYNILLLPYFQSLGHPLDMDHVYHQYEISPKLKTDLLVTIIKKVGEKKFKRSIFKKNQLSSRRFLKWTMEAEYPRDFGKEFVPATLKKYLDIERAQFRFEINQQPYKTTVMLMSFVSSNLKEPNSMPIKRECWRIIEKCIFKTKKIKHAKGDREEITNFMCPQCIDIFLSNKLLDAISKGMISNLNATLRQIEGKLSRTESYSPII